MIFAKKRSESLALERQKIASLFCFLLQNGAFDLTVTQIFDLTVAPYVTQNEIFDPPLVENKRHRLVARTVFREYAVKYQTLNDRSLTDTDRADGIVVLLARKIRDLQISDESFLVDPDK